MPHRSCPEKPIQLRVARRIKICRFWWVKYGSTHHYFNQQRQVARPCWFTAEGRHGPLEALHLRCPTAVPPPHHHPQCPRGPERSCSQGPQTVSALQSSLRQSQGRKVKTSSHYPIFSSYSHTIVSPIIAMSMFLEEYISIFLHALFVLSETSIIMRWKWVGTGDKNFPVVRC